MKGYLYERIRGSPTSCVAEALNEEVAFNSSRATGLRQRRGDAVSSPLLRHLSRTGKVLREWHGGAPHYILLKMHDRSHIDERGRWSSVFRALKGMLCSREPNRGSGSMVSLPHGSGAQCRHVSVDWMTEDIEAATLARGLHERRAFPESIA